MVLTRGLLLKALRQSHRHQFRQRRRRACKIVICCALKSWNEPKDISYLDIESSFSCSYFLFLYFSKFIAKVVPGEGEKI